MFIVNSVFSAKKILAVSGSGEEVADVADEDIRLTSFTHGAG